MKPLLPWPRAIPGSDGAYATSWVLAYEHELLREDAETTVQRAHMHDPGLRMEAAVEDSDRIVVTFTSDEAYDADSLSRSVVALQLVARVIGKPASVLGCPVADWPFFTNP